MTSPQVEYRSILLTKAQVAIVDCSEFEKLNKYKWFAWWNPSTETFYAVRTERVDGKCRTVYMHRQILGLEYGDRRLGDHKTPKTTLDNRIENLRIADRQGNSANCSIQKNSTSGYKGVTWDKEKKKWMAQIMVKRKNINLGRFTSKEEAHAAYCVAAERYFGEFARF